MPLCLIRHLRFKIKAECKLASPHARSVHFLPPKAPRCLVGYPVAAAAGSQGLRPGKALQAVLSHTPGEPWTKEHQATVACTRYGVGRENCRGRNGRKVMATQGCACKLGVANATAESSA